MLELLFIPLLILYFVSLAVLVSRIRPPNLRASGAIPSPRLTEPDLLREQSLRLWIEGTERLNPRTVKFVSAFGIDARTLRDLRIYAKSGGVASLPPRLAELLRELHREGCANGAEIAGLLFRGRALREGEALYFALIDLPPEPRVLAFIDRRRD
jgi:hypothetical protein